MLETVEENSAFFQIHEGAIYLHQGEAYMINSLDIENHVAVASPATVPYYTQVRDVTELRVVKITEQKAKETKHA